MNRTIYHVTPAGEEWRVKRTGARQAASVHQSKPAAIARAKQLAKLQRSGKCGCIGAMA